MIKTPATQGDVPSIAALWSLPFAFATMWVHAWAGLLKPAEREIDRTDRGAQLPIPNPLQKAKDSDLFA